MIQNNQKIGLIHYYFGDGKGKTSTLIGGIIRAHGHQLKTLLIQFLKLHDATRDHSGYFMGEIDFLKKIIPIKQYGAYNFVYSAETASDDDKMRAKKGFEYAKRAVLSSNYDLVALDEVIDAITLNLIKLEDFLELLQNKPSHVEIICTGYSYIKEIREIADYVIEFKCNKHPYTQGIEARPGIEY
ncbi:MAG: cob(I)yrinic acid a,c-diamide adenosyltransferase [Promethearchaeota archaeon]